MLLRRNARGRASPGGTGSLRERLQAPAPGSSTDQRILEPGAGRGEPAGEGCGGLEVVPGPCWGTEPATRPAPGKGALLRGVGGAGGLKLRGAAGRRTRLPRGGKNRRAAGRGSERVCGRARGSAAADGPPAESQPGLLYSVTRAARLPAAQPRGGSGRPPPAVRSRHCLEPVRAGAGEIEREKVKGKEGG